MVVSVLGQTWNLRLVRHVDPEQPTESDQKAISVINFLPNEAKYTANLNLLV